MIEFEVASSYVLSFPNIFDGKTFFNYLLLEPLTENFVHPFRITVKSILLISFSIIK